MKYTSVLLLLWLTVFVLSSTSSSPTPSGIAKPNCRDTCGGISIPYPFGIGPNCFYDPFYEIFCDHSFEPPKPFLRMYNLEVTLIRWPHDFITFQSSYSDNYFNQSLTVRAAATDICGRDSALLLGLDFTGSPYGFSNWDNVLLLKGCSGSVGIRNSSGQIVAGCSSLCDTNLDPTINLTTCHGLDCCISSVQQSEGGGYMINGGSCRIYDKEMSSKFYETALDHAIYGSTNTCTLSAALIQADSVNEIAGKLSNLGTFSTVLKWNFKGSTRKIHNIICCTDDSGARPLCLCKEPYVGNPYLPNGCQVREECLKYTPHHCSYNQSSGTFYYNKTSWSNKPLLLGLSTSIGLVLVILGCYWLYRFIKWRREIWRKAKCFKRNGGLLLQQQMSCSDGVIEKMKVFTVSELEKATDNFHGSRILGQGGQGTVYKGMLVDGRLVAIKKSTKVDEGQLDQFINEVVILSQINHRNVVKLLGCCLETEVPWLVYEFIPNGTLYQHIHDPTEDFHVGWKMRLQIATESAGALAYLHSSSYAPIYHRDIKSSNILLDEKYRAKISDFGTSRAINIEQTHVTTRVQGTYGYLDPEYFQSNRFTDKSDVYSFGVVLVELLTGRKPIFPTDCGGWKSLAVEFANQMDMSCVFDIVDTRVVEEGKKEEFIAVANLAKRCLIMNGKYRPTMKEVATILHGIRSPNSKEPDSVSGKCVVTEISNSTPSATEMFSTATDSFSSLSIEVQPLMSDTQ